MMPKEIVCATFYDFCSEIAKHGGSTMMSLSSPENRVGTRYAFDELSVGAIALRAYCSDRTSVVCSEYRDWPQNRDHDLDMLADHGAIFNDASREQRLRAEAARNAPTRYK